MALIGEKLQIKETGKVKREIFLKKKVERVRIKISKAHSSHGRALIERPMNCRSF